MLAEVDVDMELNVMEHSTYVSIWYGKEFEQAVYGFSYEVPPFIGRYLTDASGNYNFFSDPEVDRLIPEIYKLFMEPDRQAELIQEVAYDHIATQLPALMNVTMQDYIMWWPWVRDYQGEWAVGWGNHWPNAYMYTWMDEDMKEEMGY
jgi:ABC-type transport system substrate-binding protein